MCWFDTSNYPISKAIGMRQLPGGTPDKKRLYLLEVISNQDELQAFPCIIVAMVKMESSDFPEQANESNTLLGIFSSSRGETDEAYTRIGTSIELGNEMWARLQANHPNTPALMLQQNPLQQQAELPIFGQVIPFRPRVAATA